MSEKFESELQVVCEQAQIATEELEDRTVQLQLQTERTILLEEKLNQMKTALDLITSAGIEPAGAEKPSDLLVKKIPETPATVEMPTSIEPSVEGL